MIIVDASVAAKWVLNEPDSDAALKILESDRGKLAAPAIARIEVANAIVRRLREGGITQPEAEAAWLAWDQMLRDEVIALSPNEGLLNDAVRIAIEIRHAVPDCLYLALAIELDATVITADEPLYKRGRKAHGAVQQLRKAA
jgi:predicted nucleic acid-binding protein